MYRLTIQRDREESIGRVVVCVSSMCHKKNKREIIKGDENRNIRNFGTHKKTWDWPIRHETKKKIKIKKEEKTHF